MQSDRSRGLLAVATTLILLLSAACNPGGDEPARPADDSSATSAAAAGGEGREGSSAGAAEGSGRPIDPSRRMDEADLPEGVEASVPTTFPDDIAIYPGAEPAQGKGLSRDGINMSAVHLLTGDPADEAFDFYSRKLESDGWTLDNVKENEIGGSVSATKGERKAVILITPASDGGADIMIVTEG